MGERAGATSRERAIQKATSSYPHSVQVMRRAAFSTWRCGCGAGAGSPRDQQAREDGLAHQNEHQRRYLLSKAISGVAATDGGRPIGPETSTGPAA